MSVPPEAVQAARMALYGLPISTYTWEQLADVALEAAEPLIAAAERERIAQLAQDVAATYWQQGEYTGGPRSVRPFAALIREEKTT